MTIQLYQELIEEIFERLPPKTLLRFRSLSKSWYSHISSPDFIHRHKSRSVEKYLIVHKTRDYYRFGDEEVEYIYTLHSEDQLPLCDGEFSYEDIMPVKIPGLYPEIVGSCNGIICLVDYSNDECRICLWNFSIRRKLIVPDHPCLKDPDTDVVLGFGFDPVTNDYKIVCISYCENESFLYSMKTNSWSEIPFFITPFSIVQQNQACLVDGALHWVVKYHGKQDHFIMTFHLSSHVFGTIALPEPMWNTRQITVINGSLAVISRYTDKYSGVDNTCMWVMREYDNAASWSKVINLDMRNFEKAKVMKPITNGCLVFNTMGQWYKVYNHETRDLTRLKAFRAACDDIETKTYVESLELLDKGTSFGETISWTKTTGRMFSYSYYRNNNGV